MKLPDDVEDEEIKLLASTLPYIIRKGRANTAIDKYKSGWSGWVEWSKSKDEVSTRPAQPFFVVIYLNYLYFTRQSKGCVTIAFYGIRWAHHAVGLESPTDNTLVKLTLEGCLRLCGGEKSKKEAIPVDILKNFVDSYGTSNLKDLRFLVVCLTGFAGFLRIKELLKVQLKHVTFFEDHMKIFLPFSKMDQHREGNTVYIAKTGSKYCPVKHVKDFLEKAQLDTKTHEDAFLIPTLHKTKRGHRASKTKGISYTRVS